LKHTSLAEHFNEDPSSSSASGHIQEIVEAARRHLDMDVGFVARFCRGRRVYVNVDSVVEAGPKAGDSDPLEKTFCNSIVNGEVPGVIPDVSRFPALEKLPLTKTAGIGAYIGVPIAFSDGEIYGTLCCYSRCANPSLNQRDLKMVRLFAELASRSIEKEQADIRNRQKIAARVQEVLDDNLLSIVYQPVMKLETDLITGYEALSRFTADTVQGPDKWFADAQLVGLSAELEHAAIRLALEGLDRLSGRPQLGVNISPDTIMTSDLDKLFAGAPLERIVLEITEHALVSDYDRIKRKLDPLRAKGLSLAIDDAGAGYNSFQHIVNLNADIIKLDMSLVRNIDKDTARRALARSLIAFSEEMDCKLVAEGVETERELSCLRELGVNYAQGYFIGRPEPLNTPV
jgi:EAL domain-containing protein (putative c-di-GMP-specific phosphodiesterase class I)